MALSSAQQELIKAMLGMPEPGDNDTLQANWDAVMVRAAYLASTVTADTTAQDGLSFEYALMMGCEVQSGVSILDVDFSEKDRGQKLSQIDAKYRAKYAAALERTQKLLTNITLTTVTSPVAVGTLTTTQPVTSPVGTPDWGDSYYRGIPPYRFVPKVQSSS